MVKVLSRAHSTCHTTPLHYSVIHFGLSSMEEEGRGNGEMLVKWYKDSVMQDE